MTTTLGDYIKKQDDLSAVAMVRISVNGQIYDYTNWKLTAKKLYLFDENYKISHILWLSDLVTIKNDYEIILQNKKILIQIELFYGGMTTF